jgi:hypothetical protein
MFTPVKSGGIAACDVKKLDKAETAFSFGTGPEA